MTNIATHKIDVALPTEVLVVLARACGFTLSYDRSPGADEWTLDAERAAGPIKFVARHVGTREQVCAFLTGHAVAQQLTTQILNEIEQANRELVDEMRTRVGNRHEGDRRS